MLKPSPPFTPSLYPLSVTSYIEWTFTKPLITRVYCLSYWFLLSFCEFEIKALSAAVFAMFRFMRTFQRCYAWTVALGQPGGEADHLRAIPRIADAGVLSLPSHLRVQLWLWVCLRLPPSTFRHYCHYSAHGIAMPKPEGNMFYRCRFFMFFLISMPTLWGHWTDLNQTWTDIHLGLLFEKFGSNVPGIYPPQGMGTKTAFWNRLWTLTEHISATKHDINNRKETCQSAGTPLHAPKFGELLFRNGWEQLASFCPPLTFRIARHCQPYHMDVI